MSSTAIGFLVIGILIVVNFSICLPFILRAKKKGVKVSIFNWISSFIPIWGLFFCALDLCEKSK